MNINIHCTAVAKTSFSQVQLLSGIILWNVTIKNYTCTYVHNAINLVHGFIADNHFKTKYPSIIRTIL